jgi:hypothetical protein
MTPEGKTQKQPDVQAKQATEDLSQAIDLMMERQPDEQVKSVRVFGDRYRCNWWVREKTGHWMSLCTGVIRKSRFLRATQTAGKLLIEDLSDRR